LTRIRTGKRSWKSGRRGAPGRMEERGGAVMGTKRREMERLVERVEQQTEDVRTMVAEIWTTMAAIVEAQKKILKRVEGIEQEQMRRGAIEAAAQVEQEDILDEIREAQKEHTAALQTMNEVMKGALMVMRGSCRE